MDEQTDEDPLNKAFSVLMLQQSEIHENLKAATFGSLESEIKEDDGTPQVQMVDTEDK